VSVYNTAEYMKANPNAKVNIVAYADKQPVPRNTTSHSPKDVPGQFADALINDYGISSAASPLNGRVIPSNRMLKMHGTAWLSSSLTNHALKRLLGTNRIQ